MATLLPEINVLRDRDKTKKLKCTKKKYRLKAKLSYDKYMKHGGNITKQTELKIASIIFVAHQEFINYEKPAVKTWISNKAREIHPGIFSSIEFIGGV